MSRVECVGLDGTNPLHFLAGLGVFRILEREDASVKMGWRFTEGQIYPFYERELIPLNMGVLVGILFDWMEVLGKVGSTDRSGQSGMNGLKAELKKKNEKRKEATKKLKNENRGKSKDELMTIFSGALGTLDQEIDSLRIKIGKLQEEISDTLGLGMAHLGDIVGVKPEIFRFKSKDALEHWFSNPRPSIRVTSDPELTIAGLSALACDQVVTEDGRLTPTPYSFSNGSSGQCLLKDFRACSEKATREFLIGTLNGNPEFLSDVTGLNWNPSDQRSYALQAGDPQKGIVEDPCVNALAFIGLSVLTAVPTGQLDAVGWDSRREDRGFRWPLWGESLPLSVIHSMLSLPMEEQLGRGWTVRKSKVVNPNGKRNFFAPSRSL